MEWNRPYSRPGHDKNDTTIDSLIYQINNSSTAGVKAYLQNGRIVLESMLEDTVKLIRDGIFALITPVITSVDGL